MNRPISRALGASLLLSLFSLSSSYADEIVLNGGTAVRGVVLEERETEVEILLPAGDTLTFKRDDVRTISRAKPTADNSRHMRHVTTSKPGKLPAGLHVGVTTYVHPDGKARVDLIGAVHIAEKEFYRDVQRILEDATVVLYEGIKPKNAKMHEALESAPTEMNPIRELQTKMAKWFGMAFQLEAINYNRPHFVHADMTAEEFMGGGKAPVDTKPTTPSSKSDTPTTPPGKNGKAAPTKPKGAAAKITGQAATLQGLLKVAGPLLDMLIGKGDQGGPMRRMMKNKFAEVMGSVDMLKMMNVTMPDTAELLLTKRNDIVTRRVKEQMAKLGAKDSIAIFYGAAHLPGIEKDLIEKLGYKRAGTRWLSAWNTEK